MTDTSAKIPSVWDRVKSVFLWVWKKILAPGVALVVVAFGVVFLSMGAKDLQIGGLLKKLLSGWLKNGPPDPTKTVPSSILVANQIPAGRVDSNGKLIPQGTPDSNGITQAVVVPIQTPGGLFSNPNTVTITPPGSPTSVQVTLPTGVKSKDVDKVVVVQPGHFVVTVKDTSGISAQTIDDLLKKYGG